MAESEKHQAIIQAASDVFGEVGFAKARIEDIAKRASVGKGTVYEYFSSKEQLLLECCMGVCQQNEQKIAAIPIEDLSADADLAEVLHHLIQNIVITIVGSGRRELRLFIQLWEVADNSTEMTETVNTAIQSLYQRWESMLLELYHSGAEQGSFCRVEDPAFISHLVTACIDGWIWQKSFRPEIQAESIGKRLADHIVHLLTPGAQHA